MAMLNYTTKVPAARTVAEVQALLGAKGAIAVATMYAAGRATGVQFVLELEHGPTSFALPVDVQGVRTALSKARITGGISRASFQSEEHAERVAWRVVKDWLEENISAAQRGLVRALLERKVSVIVDDTNLRLRFARAWAELAHEASVEFEVLDVTTPVEVCIERDALRAGTQRVGRAAIEDMAKRFAVWPAVGEIEAVPAKPYTPDLTLPSAVLVDIDGTVALMQGRSPYDGTLLHTDSPNPVVVRLVKDLRHAGERIVFCSGRDEEHREVTRRWLLEHEVGAIGDALLMRPTGDTRKDAIVKRELFDQHIRDNYAVRFVLDDRNQVVRMWRSLGLTCLQVADGAF